MVDLNTLTSTSSSLSSASSSIDQASSNNNRIGRDDFLRMLMAQLKYQNPLSPVDGADFAAQLAQFSQLEQLLNLNQKLDAIKILQNSGLNALSVGYIGKTVEANAALIGIRAGVSSPINYSLSAPASSVAINIFNQYGRMVRSLDYANQAAGSQAVQFDGRDSYGGQLPDDTYSFTVSARNGAGMPVAVNTFLRGDVSGVEMRDDGSMALLVNDIPIRLNDVIRINAPGGV